MSDHVHDTPLDTPAAAPEETADAQALQGLCETHEAEISLLKDQLLRAMAETENLRKRSERDKDELGKFAVTKFARDLLSVADTFATALQSLTTPIDPSIQKFVDGISMAEKELLNALTRHGIQKIEPLHQSFDPNFHQAMAELEIENTAPQTVVQVLQAGYTIHDRLLRPALVMVSK